MICPHCRRETREGAAFCTLCGGTLTGSVQPAPPPGYSPPTPAPVSPGAPAPVAPPGPPTRPPLRGSSVALIVVVGAVLMGALGYGVVKSRTSPTPSPSVTPAPGTSVSGTAQPVVTAAPTLDCSKAEHPPQGSEARKLILDALRRHYRYDGLYTVQFVTVLNDWAYLEAAPFDEAKGETVGQFRGHVARWDGRQWNWRWEGATGAGADGAGDPPYPSDFQGAARDVLRC